MTRWAILTGEYPPQDGGVSDYTRLVALGLVAAGDSVTVYAPPQHHSAELLDDRVQVHRLRDHFGLLGLLKIESYFLSEHRPDRILIQYVPHAFGWKGMNLLFAIWVAIRARRFAPIWVMFHEIAFPFSWRPVRHAILGSVHRVMARLIVGSAERVLISIPAWAATLRKLCPRARKPEWLPIPNNVGSTAETSEISAVRARFAPDPKCELIGHFGTYGNHIMSLLRPTAIQILIENPAAFLLLIGRGSDRFQSELAVSNPELVSRVASVGSLAAEAVSAHLRACDILIQPYPDGVSSRRTSVMAGLANGIPVVTNLGHLSEAFWSTAGGVVVAGQPLPKPIVAAANNALALPAAVRAEMGKLAAEMYRSHFSIEHTIHVLKAVRQ